MIHYVQIRDGVVVNRIVADGELPPEWFVEGEEWAQDDEAQIGWLQVDGTFSPPPPVEVGDQEQDPILVLYGPFRDRWSPEEMQALLAAKAADWRVEDYLMRAVAQGHVNLSGPTAAAAKSLFVELGVLSAERADIIFAR